MKCAILLDQGFEELEAMGPIALLRRGGVEVDCISVDQKKEETGRFGVTYKPLIPMDEYDFDEADCLIVPGGPQYKRLEKNQKVLDLMVKFTKEKMIAAICAGPTLLGHLGLLKGKRYTCFTSMNEDFGGEYVDSLAVIDGNVITGRSAAASIEFAFAIMEALCGKEYADKVKSSVYYK